LGEEKTVRRVKLSKSEKQVRAARRKKAVKRVEGLIDKFMKASSIAYRIRVLFLCRRLAVQLSDSRAEARKLKRALEENERVKKARHEADFDDGECGLNRGSGPE
jgi:hypothetical protein